MGMLDEMKPPKNGFNMDKFWQALETMAGVQTKVKMFE